MVPLALETESAPPSQSGNSIAEAGSSCPDLVELASSSARWPGLLYCSHVLGVSRSSDVQGKSYESGLLPLYAHVLQQSGGYHGSSLPLLPPLCVAPLLLMATVRFKSFTSGELGRSSLGAFDWYTCQEGFKLPVFDSFMLNASV
jgi:hypothetical protein